MKRVALVLVIAAGMAALAWLTLDRLAVARALLRAVPLAPHARYVAALRLAHLERTPAVRAWIADADRVLPDARFRAERTWAGELSSAAAWRIAARRGQRLTIELDFAQPAFIDLFGEQNGDFDHVASAAEGHLALSHEFDRDGEYLVRLQPELLMRGRYRVVQRLEAALLFPVTGAGAAAIASFFGAPREGGRRRHDGIDIFAKRGTPVIAAADGWVSRTTTNRLGGNVVWVWSATRGFSAYYAHLDRRAVEPGERVKAGDILGYVGNTGNARGTSPHLHFGIYATGGAVDPLPFVCDPPCGERLMQPRRKRTERGP